MTSRGKSKKLGSTVIVGLAVAFAWAAALVLGPGGWWILAMNAGFFVLTIPTCIFPSVAALKPGMPYPLAIVIAGLLWLVTFVVIRGLFVDVLGWVLVGRRVLL